MFFVTNDGWQFARETKPKKRDIFNSEAQRMRMLKETYLQIVAHSDFFVIKSHYCSGKHFIFLIFSRQECQKKHYLALRCNYPKGMSQITMFYAMYKLTASAPIFGDSITF